MKQKKKNILCLFDYKGMSGFATVSKNIIRGLKKHYGKSLYLDIVSCADIMDYTSEEGRTRVFCGRKHDPVKDTFGRYFFLKMLKDNDYDVVFVIQDLGVFLPTMEVVNTIRKDKKKKFSVVYYYPMDSKPLKAWLPGMQQFDPADHLVPYTQYALGETLRFADLECMDEPILHGIDTKSFFPLAADERNEFRRAYFAEHADKHIVGSINRNQPRKDVPTTFFTFIEYKKKYKPDAFLYLHCDRFDPMGYNIPQIGDQLGLELNVDYRYCTEDEINAAQDVGFLNCIYNSLDKFLTTTSGEGFGLTILEAMACKVPVFAPNNTSIYELSGGFESPNMWRCDHLRPFIQHFDNMLRCQVDHERMAMIMNVADISASKTNEQVENAYKFAQSLDWEIINKQWCELFDEIVN